MHATISGTIDFREPDDESCIRRLQAVFHADGSTVPLGEPPFEPLEPKRAPGSVYEIFKSEPHEQYDMIQLL